MGDLRGARIAVVGGGVLGYSIALRLSQAKARVVLYDSRELGDSASGVAAGMLAPAFESVLDPLSTGHFPLLQAARDLWPSFVQQFDLPPNALDRSGALWVGRPGQEARLADMSVRLAAEGAQAERLTPAQIAHVQPLLAPDVIGGISTSEDWLLDPQRILPAMRAALHRLGGVVDIARVALAGEILLAEGAPVQADAVILAGGAETAGWRELAPELDAITPIKGQILHLDAAPTCGPVVRAAFGYVAPQGRGAVIGATMQPGLADLEPEPHLLSELHSGAAQVFPHLAAVEGRARAGVRASTPDGLPLVGPSSRSGLLMAIGARRNGWLLGPLVGETILAHLLGEDEGPYAAAMNPLRPFDDAMKPL